VRCPDRHSPTIRPLVGRVGDEVLPLLATVQVRTTIEVRPSVDHLSDQRFR